MPRRKPYTEIGISRVPCLRCGAPSEEQWNICADGNVFRGVCARCDVAVNALVMKFMRVPNWKAKMLAYAKKRLRALS